MAWTYCLYYVLLISFITGQHAQTISTSMPVPPLQWLNLTDLLTGPAPPPLKDSTVAYDDTTRAFVIFGGESESGFVQEKTYLLNLDTLTWSVPTPPVSLASTPAARSAALGGGDFAASNRNGFVVIGGKGSNGNPLSDVWEFDFTNQFWSAVMLSPGGPSARWGASGGIDIRTPPVQDRVLPGPNNTFYLAGGFDGKSPRPLSDIWSLSLSGTLSSNMPNTSTGSWTNLSFDDLPSRVGEASTVLHETVITMGGCDSADISSDSCAYRDSYIIDIQAQTQQSPTPCPAPRLGAALLPNLNTFSSSFTSQVFLVLGTFDTSLWQDGNGLQNGEVAVLDTNTGSWSRILPAGDPRAGARPAFPSPRTGAAAFSYATALVGGSRSSASDTIIFGGQDASGNYLAEVWLLRAYNGVITETNATWSGYSDGQLQTGVNANGAGVTVQYMTSCSTPANLSSSDGSPPSPFPSGTSSSHLLRYDTSLSHKLLSPLSLALLCPAIVLFRLVSPSYNPGHPTERHTIFLHAAMVAISAAYGIGVAGLAASFTSITSSNVVLRRSDASSTSHILLQTLHGKAGLALFIGLYALIPFLLLSTHLSRGCHHHSKDGPTEKLAESRPRTNSSDTSEMLPGQARSAPQSVDAFSATSTPRTRLLSWGPSAFWPRNNEDPPLSDNESIAEEPATKGFEVINRPTRTRTTTNSTTWLTMPAAEPHLPPSLPISPADLRNVDWLRRRRILNEVDELDYSLTQARRRSQGPETLTATVPLMTPTLPSPTYEMPRFPEALLRALFHAFLLSLCILTLIALWSRAPRTLFAVFLAWTLCFYLLIFTLAWHCKPHRSVIAVILCKLRTPTHHPHPPTISSSAVPENDGVPFPSGPYVHRPPHHATASPGQDDGLPVGPRSVETDDDDDNDDDEDTRQRRIEDEMGRREVSIVTVPRRKLLIANPS